MRGWHQPGLLQAGAGRQREKGAFVAIELGGQPDAEDRGAQRKPSNQIVRLIVRTETAVPAAIAALIAAVGTP